MSEIKFSEKELVADVCSEARKTVGFLNGNEATRCCQLIRRALDEAYKRGRAAGVQEQIRKRIAEARP